MSLGHGVSIVLNGLVLAFDAANVRSYPGTGTTWTNLIPTSASVATLTGSPTYSSNNQGILTFDGSTMYAATPTALPALSIGNTYSFETVAKRSGATSDTIVWGWQGFNGGILMQSNVINAGDWYSNGVGGWLNTTASSGITAQLDTWYHIVSTFNALGFIRIYVNGISRASVNVSGFTTSSGNTWYRVAPITFAGYNFAGYRFPGSISYGRLYNTELSAAEVLQNFNAVSERYGL